MGAENGRYFRTVGEIFFKERKESGQTENTEREYSAQGNENDPRTEGKQKIMARNDLKQTDEKKDHACCTEKHDVMPESQCGFLEANKKTKQ